MRTAESIRSRLVRRFYPYGAERRVLLGPLRGYRFIVERGHGFSYALGMGSYNFRFLARHIREGMVVYDIGANCGQVALFFSQQVGRSGYVHAFEPAAVPFRTLQRNVSLNDLRNVRTWPVVVSETTGDVLFTYFADRPTEGKPADLATKEQPGQGECSHVRAITLDAIINEGERKPDLLKIDVEGSAAAVLAGARDTLDRFGPSIYIELHNAEERKAVRDELHSRGYQLQTIDGRKVVDPTTRVASPLWCWRER